MIGVADIVLQIYETTFLPNITDISQNFIQLLQKLKGTVFIQTQCSVITMTAGHQAFDNSTA